MTEIGSIDEAGIAAKQCIVGENRGTKLRAIGNHIAQLRPHYRRRGQDVFFLISKRPSLVLSSEEIPLYDRIDGHKTLADLEDVHPGASDKLLNWREAGLLELIPRVAAPTRPHLVVIEPHMDDAILSAGGRLLHRRGQCRITILSVVRRSNFTSYLLLKRDFMDVSEISQLRQQESTLVARVLGAEHRCLDWTDAPLRFSPSDRWSSATVEEFNNAPQDFVKGCPKQKEVSLLAQQLMQQLNMLQPDELWIPMGLGDHLDHRTTRSACLMMLHEACGTFANVPVSMYEDLPYASEPGHAAVIRGALASCGTRLVRGAEDITDVFEEKLRLSSIYASQFKPSYLEPMLGGFARREGGAAGRLVEVFHRVEGERCLPRESDLSRDRAGLVTLATGLRSLLRKRTKCHRLTVVVLPTGHLRDWKSESGSLGAALPNADVRVYAPANVESQTEARGNEKLKVEFVHGGWWPRVLWHEFFRFGTPTIVMWRGAYSSTPPMRPLKKLINILIKSFFPFRQVLFTRRLSDFCCVLHETQQESNDESRKF